MPLARLQRRLLRLWVYFLKQDANNRRVEICGIKRRRVLLDAFCRIVGQGRGFALFIPNVWAGISIIIVLFMGGCAKVGPPPGGAVDRKGPEIVNTYPQNLSTNIPIDSKLRFKISEWYDQASFEDAFFISPRPKGDIKFKYKLREVVVSFKGNLSEDRTYIVTIGTDFRDLNRNNMASSFTLTFSTGERFEYGMIRGKVWGRKREGLVVALYNLADEFLFREREGEYLTQTGKDGEFTFKYLPPAEYRVLIFSDADYDRLFDLGKESLGLAYKDITIAGDTSEVLYIKTTLPFADPPIINSVNVLDREKIDIIFDRPVEFLPSKEQVLITDTLTGNVAIIKGIYRLPGDSTRMRILTGQLTNSIYSVRLYGGSDFSGMVIDDSLLFQGTASRDTLAPGIIRFSAEGDTASSDIWIVTTEPVNTDTLLYSLRVKDGSLVEGGYGIEETDYCKYGIWSDRVFSGDTLYLNLWGLMDEQGNRGIDSTISVDVIGRKPPPEVSELGSLSGEVVFSGEDAVWISLLSSGSEVGRVRVEHSGKFRFSGVPSGYYRIQAFIDRDDNGRYDYGLIEPFRYAERFIWVDDSFRVRQRWETTGVRVDFERCGGED